MQAERETQPARNQPASSSGERAGGSFAARRGRLSKTLAAWCPGLGLLTSRERYWSTGILTLVVPLPIFLLGFTLGFASSATLDLTGEANELPGDYFLPPHHISLFVAMAPLGAIFGGPFGGWIAQHWGRKCSLMFSGVPYITGYLLLSYAHYTSTTTVFIALLHTGRFTSGLGAGWGSAMVAVYIGESCSVLLRGIAGAVSQAIFTLGIAFSLALGAIDHFRYYNISLVAVGIVALFEVLMFWLPETPRWLLSRGYVERAEQVLLWLRGTKVDIKKEMEDIKKTVLMNMKNKKNIMRKFSKRSIMIPFIYVLVIFFFQQASGINATAAHAGRIISDAGVSNPRATSVYGVGVASLMGNIVAFFLIDFLGRVTLLILSGTGMFLGCTVLGLHFYVTRASLCSDTFSSNSTYTALDTVALEHCNAHFAPMAITSVVLYRFSFAIGLGPVPWILLSELLPLSVRGFASGLVMIVTWSTSVAVVGLFLEYVELVQYWFAMWTFGLFNLAMVLFVIVFLPETKGKSLEHLERKFVKLPKVVETVL